MLPPRVMMQIRSFCLILLSFYGSSTLAWGQDEAATVSFINQIRPVLARNCLACHGPDETSRQADLRLDQPPGAASTAIIPGDPSASEIYQRVTSSDSDLRMPPSDSGHSLSTSEVELLRRWISEGACYETHWAFTVPVRPDIPLVKNDDWCRNAIDDFIAARHEQLGITPAPPATPHALIRRAYLDLTGLPPTPEVADQFAASPTEEAWEAVVDSLLQSPHYGEHWARMWLDLARYADTKGYEKDQPRKIWRYRDWVIDALNADMPFDEFTVQQLAGDLLPGATTEQQLATAFHRNTLTNDEGGTDNEEFRTLAVKDRVDTTMQVWMGLTAGCAKCHSHKYDPLSQREYYQLYAFFNQTADADRPDDSPRLATPTPEQQARLRELESRLAELADTTPEASSARDQLQEQLDQLRKQVPTTPVMQELPVTQRRETRVHLRGNFLEPGDMVTAALPTAFTTVDRLSTAAGDQTPDRLMLARWLVSDSNPLTARVMVNRMWSRLFGRGIVETEEDFGSQGSRPTHPRLLDWLAVEFQTTHGWSLKQLCRQILLSATYQQSVTAAGATHDLDPANFWLARSPRFRLSAECIRDQALHAAGLLSQKIGGPSVMPPQPEGIWRTTYSTLKWETPDDEDRYRRGLYTFLRRTSPYPSLVTFDAGSGEVCQIRRIRTNTPLQALITLNDPVFIEAAGGLAARVGDASDPVKSMFRWVLIRPCTVPEQSRLETLLQSLTSEFKADPRAARAMLNSARLTLPDSEHDQVVLAARTVVASVILNLDETLMRP